MRGIIVFLTIFGGIFAFQASAQCRISFVERANDIPTYVENGRACLQDIPQGFKFDEEFEARFAERINQTRREHGLPTLVYRTELRNAARWHSLDMAANDFFNHQGLDATMPKDRINALDRTLLTSLLLENIASITGNFDWDTVVERLHTGLMNSPSHRDAILRDGITHFAMGVVTTERGVWLTELFVRQDGSFDRPVPLRIDAGTTIRQPATLRRWKMSGLAMMSGDNDAVDLPEEGWAMGRVPPTLRGKIDLTVRGEKAGPQPNQTVYIHFHGPTVEVRPARSS
ncbi:CAP domain-containing protein [Henriciella marina]|uniref:CAP domain-containing protein n=1 Tax=Henriciella marina TaxID=453851 RepID=UPI00037F8483|nr:CAP domain-containing protein [Henriciella marina]